MSPHALAILTGLSLALAAIMSVVAWRASRAERRRSEARIVALSAEIHEAAPMASVAGSAGRRVEIGIRGEPPRRFPASTASGPRTFMEDLPLRDALTSTKNPALGQELFARAQSDRTSSGVRLVAVIALGLFVVAAVAALVFVSGGALPSLPTAGHARRASAATARPPSGAPIELVGLSHERDGDRLTIKGVVHNPDAGVAIDGLEAIVSIYDRDGAVMTSAHAPLAQPVLGAGR